ncbi:Putative ATP-dependent RNA helicase A, partial [Durusdinium trenchii]
MALRRCLRRCAAGIPPPPPPRPSSLRLQSPATPPAATYVRSNLHKALAAAGGQQQPELVFSCFWRYCDRFEPSVVELDASLNALVKCNRDAWSSQQFGGCEGNAALTDKDILRLLGYIEQLLPTTSAGGTDAQRYLTTFAWALASLAHWQPKLSPEVLKRLAAIFEVILEMVEPLLESFDCRHLAMMSWAMARAHLGTPVLFQRMGDMTLKMSSRLGPTELARLVSAFARAKQRHRWLQEAPRMALRE